MESGDEAELQLGFVFPRTLAHSRNRSKYGVSSEESRDTACSTEFIRGVRGSMLGRKHRLAREGCPSGGREAFI